MESPILCLKESITASIERIAPEMKNELQVAKSQNPLTFSFVDEASFKFRVSIKRNVTLPIPGLELLWSASYLYYLLYQEYVKAQKSGVGFQLNTPTLEAGWKIYNRGRDGITKSAGKWNASLPQPSGNPEPESLIHVANEIFLCAVAWILHHEFSHVRLNHAIITCNSREEERDSDKAATVWIFDNCDCEAMKEKRSIGVAVALLLLTNKDLLSGKFDDSTHPKAFNRLYDCLCHSRFEDDHIVYPFSIAILQIHIALANKEISTDSINGEKNFKDQFSDIVCQLSQTCR